MSLKLKPGVEEVVDIVAAVVEAVEEGEIHISVEELELPVCLRGGYFRCYRQADGRNQWSDLIFDQLISFVSSTFWDLPGAGGSIVPGGFSHCDCFV